MEMPGTTTPGISRPWPGAFEFHTHLYTALILKRLSNEREEISMFNDYIWKLYLKADGNDVVRFFEENLLDSFSKNYAHRIRNFHSIYCPDQAISDILFYELEDLSNSTDNADYEFLYGCYPVMNLPKRACSLADIMKAFYRGLNDNDVHTLPTRIN